MVDAPFKAHVTGLTPDNSPVRQGKWVKAFGACKSRPHGVHMSWVREAPPVWTSLPEVQISLVLSGVRYWNHFKAPPDSSPMQSEIRTVFWLFGSLRLEDSYSYN